MINNDWRALGVGLLVTREIARIVTSNITSIDLPIMATIGAIIHTHVNSHCASNKSTNWRLLTDWHSQSKHYDDMRLFLATKNHTQVHINSSSASVPVNTCHLSCNSSIRLQFLCVLRQVHESEVVTTVGTAGVHYSDSPLLGLYRICFWEIRPEPDFAGFVKQIRPEPVPDFTI